MNYIGSKRSLIDFLKKEIFDVAQIKKNETKGIWFADGFAGTGIVGKSFKSKGMNVLSNDIQYYSFVINRHYIGVNKVPKYKNLGFDPFEYFNNSKGKKGFIYNNYCVEGTKGQEYERNYFTPENAMLIDQIREDIEKWHTENRINDDEYYYLISCLLEAADKVANTAAVYGAFLKHIKKSAQNRINLVPLKIIEKDIDSKIDNSPIEEWILKSEGDILYLDPPYNHRQYATNYHMLETIAKYDNPIIYGKTGLREYSEQKSNWCSKSKVVEELEHVIKNAKFKYIFLSYNNEGIMSLDEVREVMEKYGAYKLKKQEYKRFKADNNRQNKADNTTEYLHCLIKK
ncbi:MAG TPA: DNA adenine methylase [Gallicola sp.]|nr:DNA adenine methylase [Gallicola sp.]